MQVTNLLFSLLVVGASAKKCTRKSTSVFATTSTALQTSTAAPTSTAVQTPSSTPIITPTPISTTSVAQTPSSSSFSTPASSSSFSTPASSSSFSTPASSSFSTPVSSSFSAPASTSFAIPTSEDGTPQSTLLTRISASSSSEISSETIVIITTTSEAVTTTSAAASAASAATSSTTKESSTSSDNLNGDQNNALNAINAARAEVGTSALTWDEELVASAQQWADHLTTVGSLVHSGSGENLYWASGSSTPLVDAVNGWNSEKSNYKGGAVTTDNLASIGHYTQNVWKSTTKFGIASATDSNGGVYVVAHYDPVGNFLGQAPY